MGRHAAQAGPKLTTYDYQAVPKRIHTHPTHTHSSHLSIRPLCTRVAQAAGLQDACPASGMIAATVAPLAAQAHVAVVSKASVSHSLLI